MKQMHTQSLLCRICSYLLHVPILISLRLHQLQLNHQLRYGIT